jgi:DNA replication ATP-dependent helicase Dna2
MPGDAESLLSITGLHEIEEDIWSPKWGLKGKVDASVQASIILDRKAKNAPREIHVAPLEIKTGRSVGVMNHRAQTMLYTLLMEDRYGMHADLTRTLDADEAGVPVPAGLLYYSQLDTVLRVEARPAEIRSLITARNELASYFNQSRKLAAPPAEPYGFSSQESASAVRDVEDGFLPPTINSARECKGCYAVDTCMLYRKVSRAAAAAWGSELIGRRRIGPRCRRTTRSVLSTRRKWGT